MAGDKTIDKPSQAWLTPIAGIGVTIFLNIAIEQLFSNMEPTRLNRFAQGFIPFSALLMCIGYGYFKSVQCLRRWRNPFHGIAGLLVNTAMVGLIVLVFGALQAARNNAKELMARPDRIVEQFCADAQVALPAEIDAMTILRRIYADPPLVVNFEYVIRGIDREQLSDEVIRHYEDHERQRYAQERPFPELEGIGVSLRHVYRHESAEVVLDFTIDL